jgi:hypothetical protein
MSYFHSLLSKEMDSVKRSTSPDVFCLNLPAHGFFIPDYLLAAVLF